MSLRTTQRARALAGTTAHGARRQRGIALIVGMVILLVLALLGVSAYSVATQDERLAGNARDRARAQDAAESMLRECESALSGGSYAPVPAPAVGNPWVGDSPYTAWTGTYGMPPGKVSTAAWLFASTSPTTPQCIAEEFDLPPSSQGAHRYGQPAGGEIPTKIARVTAVGFGIAPTTQVTLISYYAYY